MAESEESRCRLRKAEMAEREKIGRPGWSAAGKDVRACNLSHVVRGAGEFVDSSLGGMPLLASEDRRKEG